MDVFRSVFLSARTICGPIEEALNGKIGSQPTKAESRIVQDVGRVDFLLGGPPCQGHSSLNNHSRHDDPRNGLYVRMARAAEILSPEAMLVENVPTVTRDVQKAVYRTIDHLQSLGYAVGDGIVDLSNLGVPQRRRRHIIVALRDSERDPQDLVRRLNLPICGHVPRSVRWAIGDLEDRIPNNLFESASKSNSTNSSRIDWLFDNDNFDLPNEFRPQCQRSDHSYTAMYGRMPWESPAQTVTTGFGSTGQGRYVHPSRRRVITPHEAARLQTIPDFVDFSLVPTRKHLAKLIGNSVPPMLSFIVGKITIPLLRGFSQTRPKPGALDEGLVNQGK